MKVAAFGGGDGVDENTPYLIEDCTDLQNMANSLGAFYKLANDIDCSATASWNSGAGFAPIGNSSTRFTGYFDGNNKTISNLTINRPSLGEVGLFGFTNDAEIMDLTLENFSIVGDTATGVLVGFSRFGIIDNITVTSAEVSGDNYAAGLIAVSVGDEVTNSYVESDTVSQGYAGGIMASLTGDDALIGLTQAHGTIRGYNDVGGAFGILEGGPVITKTFTTVEILGDPDGGTENQYNGGFVGRVECANISESFSTGDVTGADVSGGFAGALNEDGICPDSGITDSYALGDVYTTDDSYYGSFVAFISAAEIDNSYAVGEVSGRTDGGFTSADSGCVGCNNLFYENDESNQSSGDLGTGKSSTELKNLATFTDTDTVGLTTAWDFEGAQNDDASNEDIWEINSELNDGFPYLAYQDYNPNVTTYSPSTGASGVSLDSNLVLTFDTPSGASSGNITIYRSNGTIQEQIDVAGGLISGNGTATLTINPFKNLDYSTTYYVLIDSTAIRANYGKYFEGISDSTVWRFTTKSLPSSNTEDSTETTPTTTNSVNTQTATSTANSLVNTIASSGIKKSFNLDNLDGFNTDEGALVGLKVGDTVYFIIEGEKHSFTVTEIGADYVKGELRSDPQDVTLKINSEGIFDANGDFIDDISMLLVDVTSNRANINFKTITQDSREDVSPTETSADAGNVSEEANHWARVGLVGIVVIVALGAIIAMKSENNKRA